LNFSGTAIDPDGTVASVRWRVGGGSFQTATGTTSWNFSAPLITGANLVEVQSVDNEGLSSNLSNRTITRRAPNVAPTVTITVPGGDQTVNADVATLNFSGTAGDTDGSIASVRWRVGGGSFQTATGTTSWSFTAPLATGANSVEVQSVDNEGLTSNLDSRTITRRAPNIAPTVAITEPASDQTVNSDIATFNFSGTAIDTDGTVASVRWRVGGGSFQTATGTAAWSFSAPLATGANLVEVRSVDNEGLSSNLSSRTITRRAPNVAPTVTITEPASDQAVDSDVTSFAFSGTAIDTDGSVESVRWRVGGGSFQTATGTTAWSLSAPLTTGANLVEVQSVDNEGLSSNLDSRTITRLSPSVPNDSLAGAVLMPGNSGELTSASTDATREVGEPNHWGGSPGYASLWWTWTPTDSGVATIQTCGSNFDTVLAVYTGSEVGLLTRVDANDDNATVCGSSGSSQSALSFNAQAGIAYRVVVSSYNEDETGTINLAWTLTPSTGSPPTVVVVTPLGDQTVKFDVTTFAFSGTAADTDGSVASVRWRVNGGSFQTATGTTSWNFTAPLVTGENLVEVQAVDNEGLSSNLDSRIITRREPAVAPAASGFLTF
jgi:hypothetical protein